jgi:hypothetical protein
MKIQKWLMVVNVILFFGTLTLAAAVLLPLGAVAQEPTATPSTEATTPDQPNWFGPGFGMGRMGGRHGGMMGGPGGMMGGPGGMMGGPENSLIAVTAEQLDMTVVELLTELQADETKTISQVAYEHNVDLTTIIDAFMAPRTERLQQLVDNGQLTQEQADEFLTQMRTMATQHATEPWSEHQPGPRLTDENGDGVCDYRDGNQMGGPGGMMGGPGGMRGGPMGGQFGGPMGGNFGGPRGGHFWGPMGGWFNNWMNNDNSANEPQ